MPDGSPLPDGVSRFGTAASAIRALSARLREAGLPASELDARLLVLGAADLSHENYVLAPEQPFRADVLDRIESFAARRIAREPVSRILGHREFWGRNFALSAATLDPRPETETLVEAILASIEAEGRRDQPLRLLDLGTGTGCILLSVLAELPEAWGVGVDIDPKALTVARANAAAHGLVERAAFCCGDWVAAFFAGFDFIFANPPYIKSNDIAGLDKEVSVYDPKRALDGGPDGFDAYRRIAYAALDVAAPGAWLALEAGAGQMRQLCDLLVKAGWQHNPSSPRMYADLSGHHRVVVVRKQQ
jgi:release factor glutamine methyltransferase